MFLDALAYPIRRSGWIMIVIGALFSVLLNILKFAPFVGLLVAIFSAGYFGAFYLDIVSTTMGGRNEVPDWPSFTNFWDDIMAPFARLFALMVISFGPLIALHFLADHKAGWFMPAYWCCIAYGCFYFPMAVLATQAFGNVGGALPHIVFPALSRSLPSYLLAVVGLVVAFVAFSYAQDFASAVPYVGWFLTAAVSLYAMMFQGRLIGRIYLDKRDVLGWD